MINFPVDLSPYPGEQLLRTIHNGVGQGIRLPKRLKQGGGFGLLPFLIQVIATWARLNEETKLITVDDHFGSDSEWREAFSSSPVNMAALYFADQVSSGGERFNHDRWADCAARPLEAMRNNRLIDTARGLGAFLSCFDHEPFEFLNSLYWRAMRSERGEFVRTATDFVDLTGRLLDSAGEGTSRILGEEKVEFLGGLFHQLFKNADGHGWKNSDGEEYERGMRGILVRKISFSSTQQAIAYAADEDALKFFLLRTAFVGTRRTEAKSPEGLRALSFLEASVFDTGVGMPLRFLQEAGALNSYSEISLDQEEEAVKQCFRKHVSTSTAAYAGEGLTIALNALRELKAFMVVRTGRMALYQDFGSGNSIEFDPKYRYGRHRRLSLVSGTSYSICIPLAS